MVDDTRIVTIGGGTGSSTILKGLKKYFKDITAIVTVADDGGSSGMLRDDLGVIPPGDIRACLISLANTEKSGCIIFSVGERKNSLPTLNFLQKIGTHIKSRV